MILHRHPCGLIYTQAFADHLAALHRAESPRHPGELLSLDYIRCATGPQAGSAWHQITWIPAAAIPLDHRYLFGSTLLHLHPQTRHALKNRGLDHHPPSGGLRILT